MDTGIVQQDPRVTCLDAELPRLTDFDSPGTQMVPVLKTSGQVSDVN